MPRIVPENAVLIPENASLAFSGVLFDVFQWQQTLYDGSSNTFEMLRRADSVVVIAVIDNKIVIISDEQPNRGVRIGLPGGRVDPGELPLTAAKRELKEETGYGFSNWRLVDVYQPEPKLEWFIHTFIAYGEVETSAANAGPGEKIVILHDSFDEFKTRCIKFEGFLGETLPLVMDLDTLDQVYTLPEFVGKEVA